jgi:hypothetical protein
MPKIGGSDFEPISVDKWVRAQIVRIDDRPLTPEREQQAAAFGVRPEHQIAFVFECDERTKDGTKNREMTLSTGLGITFANRPGFNDSKLARVLVDFCGLTREQALAIKRENPELDEFRARFVGRSGEVWAEANKSGNINVKRLRVVQPGTEPFKGTNVAEARSFPPKDTAPRLPDPSWVSGSGQSAPAPPAAQAVAPRTQVAILRDILAAGASLDDVAGALAMERKILWAIGKGREVTLPAALEDPERAESLLGLGVAKALVDELVDSCIAF